MMIIVPRLRNSKFNWLALFEAVTIYFLIIIYIWLVRDGKSWIILLSCVVGSHIAYREGLGRLGFRPDGFWRIFRERGEQFAGLLGLIIMLGGTAAIAGKTLRDITWEQLGMNFAWYVIWGIFQQYVLNGFFVNRLVMFFNGNAENRLVPVIAGAYFAVIHTPNWFLMFAAFVGGWASAKIFLEYRNIYALGLAHAVIGTVLYILLPDSVVYKFVVGPRYFAN